jgi:hypothetical protein
VRVPAFRIIAIGLTIVLILSCTGSIEPSNSAGSVNISFVLPQAEDAPAYSQDAKAADIYEVFAYNASGIVADSSGLIESSSHPRLTLNPGTYHIIALAGRRTGKSDATLLACARSSEISVVPGAAQSLKLAFKSLRAALSVSASKVAASDTFTVTLAFSTGIPELGCSVSSDQLVAVSDKETNAYTANATKSGHRGAACVLTYDFIAPSTATTITVSMAEAASALVLSCGALDLAMAPPAGFSYSWSVAGGEDGEESARAALGLVQVTVA